MATRHHTTEPPRVTALSCTHDGMLKASREPVGVVPSPLTGQCLRPGMLHLRSRTTVKCRGCGKTWRPGDALAALAKHA